MPVVARLMGRRFRYSKECANNNQPTRANSPSALSSKHVRRQPLAEVNFASLSVSFGRRLGLRWQLQNRRVLALVQRGE